jgi:cyclophilin family peptidyl-prolyl cis-trans isomerase
MINTGNMFSNDFQALEQLANAASKAFGQPFQETVYKPSTSAKVDFPIDEYLDKDGNYTVQMAVVGLDSEDVKVTVKTEGGVKTLNIKVNGPELTDEQKKTYTTIGGTPHLDGQYTVFGEVLEGLDIVEKIQNTETVTGDRPKQDIKIISVKEI